MERKLTASERMSLLTSSEHFVPVAIESSTLVSRTLR